MHSTPSRRRLLAAASALTLGVGVLALSATGPASAAHHGDAHASVPAAVAVLAPTAGNDTHGVIRFTPLDNGLQVDGEIHGLEPDAEHGFHVHEFGDVSKDDGTGTGGHFNPEGHDHGLPGGDHPRHAGDFGNVSADGEGVARVSFFAEGLSLDPHAGINVLGRGLIVHAKTDDGGQPTGNAGPRIAQAVIGVAAPAGE